MFIIIVGTENLETYDEIDVIPLQGGRRGILDSFGRWLVENPTSTQGLFHFALGVGKTIGILLIIDRQSQSCALG